VILLLTTVILFGATLWWYWYDPTVTANVNVTLQGPEQRIVSGSDVTVQAKYENNSDVTLTDVSLAFILPPNIAADTLEPMQLPDLQPGDNGSVPITFDYLSSPNTHDDIVAKLTYIQAQRTVPEMVVTRRTLHASESVIRISMDNPPSQLAANSGQPITLQISNDGDKSRVVRVNEEIAPGVTAILDGENEMMLAPGERQERSAVLLTDNIPPGEISLLFSPVIITNTGEVVQHGLSIPVDIIAPAIRMTSDWVDGIETLAPGQTGSLAVSITNVGDIPLSHARITLPYPSARVSSAVLREYGSVTNSTLTITSSNDARFVSLTPGESHTVTIPIYILSDAHAGAARDLQLFPRITASVPNTTLTVTDSAQSSIIRLGGSATVSARSWYYTPEGDQLGRGPLPPRVGEETKYWVSINAQNGSSNLGDVRISGSLAPGVRFTGKTSVSAGSDITYDEASGTWVYTLHQLGAGTMLGVHMELATTPSANDIGAHLPLVTDILFKAQDNYINVPITQSLSDVTTALIGDNRAEARGTRVTQ